MATLVENAVRIKQTFDDIYDAIVEKGVTPSGGVDTYPDAINNIPQQAIVSPETCPFKLVFSSFVYSNTFSVNFIDNIILDENYFVKTEEYNYKWKCVKAGRYYVFLTIGVHSSTLPSGFTAKTQYYYNDSFVTSANMTSVGVSYGYTITDMIVDSTILGNIYCNKKSYEISGKMEIYYWGET